MSAHIKQGRKKNKSTRRGPKRNGLYGNLNVPPRISAGLQVPRMIVKRSIMKREFKFRFVVATTGTQTYFVYGLYIWKPFSIYSVVAATPTFTQTLPANLTDLLAVYEYYRVRKILIQYATAVSSTLALPSYVVGLLPSGTSTTLNITGNTAVPVINALQNSMMVDPHNSCGFGYMVPKPVSLPESVLNAEPQIIKGGWIASAFASIAPTSADTGLIALSTGDTVLAAPLTTNFGVIDVIYHMEFLAPV